MTPSWNVDILRQMIDLVTDGMRSQRTGLADGDPQKLHECTDEMLWKMQGILGNVVPSLVLLDESKCIIDAWLHSFETAMPLENAPESTEGLEAFRLSLLGHSLDFHSDDVDFWDKLLARFAENDSYEPLLIVFNIIDDQCPSERIDSNGIKRIENRYQVYEYSTNPDTAETQPLCWGTDFSLWVATGNNVTNSSVLQFLAGMKRFAVICYKWPSSGPLPGIYALSAFHLDPEDDGVVDEFLSKAPVTLLLTWAIQMSAFISQLYALSQASARDIGRIADELLAAGWTKLIKESVHSQDFSTHLGTVLSINNPLLRSRIISQVATIPAIALRALLDCQHYLRIPDVNVNGWLESEGGTLLKSLPIPLPTDVSAEEHFELLRHKVIEATICDIHRFYRELGNKSPDLVMKICRESLMPSIESILEYGCLAKHDITGISLDTALIAIEEWMTFAGADTGSSDCQERIWQSLTAFIKRNANYPIPERVLVTLIFCVGNCSESMVSRFQQLYVDAACQPLLKNGQLVIPERMLDSSRMVFAALPYVRRCGILDTFGEQGYLPTQFIAVHKRPRMRTLPAKAETIAVLSGKGGTGKTTVAFALGACLAKNSANKVCIIDLDFFGPSLAQLAKATDVSSTQYLNDYAWRRTVAWLIEDAANNAKRGERIAEMLDVLFCDRSHLRTRFWPTRMAEKCSTYTPPIIQLFGRLDVIAASPHDELQDIMLPLLDYSLRHSSIKKFEPLLNYSTNRGCMRDVLKTLLQDLEEMDYTHIIIDTPAELKELSVAAMNLTTIREGKNVLVATLAPSSIEPIVRFVGATGYDSARNYLLVNRVRPLDKSMCINQGALLNYWMTKLGESSPGWCALSEAVLASALHINHCGFLPWKEDLERLYEQDASCRKKTFQSIADNGICAHLEYILGSSERRNGEC